jgi:hypothetical protein
MEQSILKAVKLAVNVSVDDPSFDETLIGHINTEFSTLHDLGVGPVSGFVIESDEETWDDFFPLVDDPLVLKVWMSKVKACVTLRVRILFDPPAQVFLLEALKGQLAEQEWRLNVNREEIAWVDPAPPDVLVVDGGDPSGE